MDAKQIEEIRAELESYRYGSLRSIAEELLAEVDRLRIYELRCRVMDAGEAVTLAKFQLTISTG